MIARVPLLAMLIPIFAAATGGCVAPTEAIAKLRGYLTYQSRIGLWHPGAKLFSFVQSNGDALFMQHEIPPHYDKSQRFVYAFRKASRLFVTGCPSGARWPECAERSFREFLHQPAPAAEQPVGAACDLTITVPAWRPSPDDSFKRRLGSEVLQELREFGYRNAKEVYVRDFNVADPELAFYIVDQSGRGNLQGCTFDADLSPHCIWHMYGMSPIEELKRDIIDHAYRLYPPQADIRQGGK